MSRLLSTLFTVLLAATVASQTVFIPDVQFRAKLNEWAPGLVDGGGYMPEDNYLLHPGDWELEVDWSPCDLSGIEAIAGDINLTIRFAPGTTVTLDSLGIHTYLKLVDFPGTSLPAIGQATSLTIQRAPFITTLDGLVIPGLTELILDDIQGVTSPPVLPAGLIGIVIRAYPDAVPLPQFPSDIGSIEVRSCGHTVLPDIPQGIFLLRLDTLPALTAVPDLPMGIETLWIGNTGIADLDVPQMVPSGLVWIRENPALTSIVLRGELYQVELFDAVSLATLEFEGSVQFLTIDRVPALDQLISFGSGGYSLSISDAASLSFLPDLPDGLNDLSVALCPALTELPSLPESLTGLSVSDVPLVCLPQLPLGLQTLIIGSTDLTCMPNHPPGITPQFPLCQVVNSRCKEDRPYAEGRFYWDADGSGDFSEGDEGIPFARVTAQPSGQFTTTDADGRYTMTVPYGVQTLSVATDVIAGTPVPPSHTVNFQMGGQAVTGLDLRIVEGNIRYDLRVMNMWGIARLGSTTENTVVVVNAGASRDDVEVRLSMDPTLVYESSEPMATVEGTELVWNLGTVGIGQELRLKSYYHVPVPTPLGSEVFSLATVGPVAEDIDPTNNEHHAQGLITGSYDPNDKQVFPASIDELAGADGTSVEYLIRFQNTGNSWAERVVVTDTLPGDLDPDSFEFLGSSHELGWFYREGALHFVFDPIFLPDSTADEPGSHGFIAFRIRTWPGLLPGSAVPNEANIYFDFNEPVITDPCVLSVEVPEGIGEENGSRVHVFPVPTNDELIVVVNGATSNAPFHLTDALGKQVLQGQLEGQLTTLDLHELRPGLYLLQVEAEGQRWIQRISKN